MGTRISSPTFVGRGDELEELGAALARADAGASGTVLISGDAGVGKSRLVAELADRARSRGAGVLVGGCLQIGEGALPYAAVSEALRGLVDELGAETLRRIAGQRLRQLGPLVPALGGGAVARPPVGQLDHGAVDAGDSLDGWAERAQVQLFDAILDLLSRLARERPQVLVLEDVHWADQSTRELLVFLTRNLRDARVLVVATHRQDELGHGHPLRPVLAELARSDRVRTLGLRPFDRDELTTLLRGILDAPPGRDLVDRVLDRSQGYPFFVEELIASGAAEGGAPLSEGLRDILLATIDGLPPATRKVLRAAAAAGRRVQHDLLARVVGLPPEEVDDAVRAAVQRRVLLADPDGATYAFRHALFAEAIQTTLLPGERRRLHRRLAEVLEDDRSLAVDTAAAELAHHWHLARDDRRSLIASLQAAREAQELHAVVDARDHVERLAACWSQVPDAAELTGVDHAGLLAWLADLTYLSGDARRAIHLMEAAEEELPEGDPLRRGQLLERFARYHSSVGDEETAAATRARAVALMPIEPPTAARANVLISYAHSFWEQEPEKAHAIAEESVAIARDVGDPIVESRGLVLLGASLATLGRLDEARDVLRHAHALAEEHAAPEELVRSSMYLGVVLIRGGHASEGADVSLRGLGDARELGLDRLYGPGLAGDATSGLFWSGRWDEAEALITEAVGSTSLVGWLQMMQARLAAHRGRFAEAHRMLQACRAHYATHLESRFLGVTIGVALLEGDTATARQLVRDRASYATPLHVGTVNELCARCLQAEAAQEEPDRALADTLLAETITDSAVHIASAEPWRLTAVAEHARITGEGLTDTWEAAREAWCALGWPYLTAYAGLRLAEAHVRDATGETGRVEELLRDAEATCAALGADPLREDVLRLAHRAGLRLVARPSSDGGTAPYGLTPREAEVLTLVADGLSNRDIGEQLFISAKTASVHVSNILRKLDVNGRGEAAAVAFREGLLAD